jgi:hypothetical protein
MMAPVNRLTSAINSAKMTIKKEEENLANILDQCLIDAKKDYSA